MMTFIGGICSLVGVGLFLLSLVFLYVVTTAWHNPGRIAGAFLHTVGQEIALICAVLSWTFVMYGWYWMFSPPTEVSVRSLFLMFFLPATVPWAVAKIYSTVGMFRLLQKRWIQLIYTGVIVFAALPVIGIPTFLPETSSRTYYGHVNSPNDLVARMFKTVAVADSYRSARLKTTDQDGLIAFLHLMPGFVDNWHDQRVGWGGERQLNLRDYLNQREKLALELDKVPGSRRLSHELRRTKALWVVDHWWLDKHPPLNTSANDEIRS